MICIFSCACVYALLLETSPCESPACRQKLADAQLCGLQSAELTASEQFTFVSDMLLDEITKESPVLDAAGPDNVIEQEDSLVSDLYDIDQSLAHLVSFSNSVVSNKLGLNISVDVSGSSQDHASYNTQEVDMAVRQLTDVTIQLNTDETSVREDIECNVVEGGPSEVHSIDQHARVSNYGDELATIGNHESVDVENSWLTAVLGGRDAYNCILHNSSIADVVTEVPEVELMWHSSDVDRAEETSSQMTSDAELHEMEPLMDCENSRFADIHVDSRARHIKLDPSQLEAVCSNQEPTAQAWLASLFNCLLDKSENWRSHRFPSATEDLQQDSGRANAGIYNYLGGMDLRDDMELTPVEERNTDGGCNSDGTQTARDVKDCLDNTINSTNTDWLLAGIFASLGRMELHDDMELVSVEDGQNDTVCNAGSSEITVHMKHYSDGTRTNASLSSNAADVEQQEEFSRATTERREMHEYKSTDHNEQQLETASRGNSGLDLMQNIPEMVGICDGLDVDHSQVVLAQPLDVSTQERMYVNGLAANTARDDGPESSQGELLLLASDEVRDRDCRNSEATDSGNETGGKSATDGARCAADMLTSSGTVGKDAGFTNVMNSAVCSNEPQAEEKICLNSTKDLEVWENVESEHSACPVLDCHTIAGFSEDSITEHHRDLQLLKNEQTPSAIYYANEDFQSYFPDCSTQLEPLTVDESSLHSQRLELDDFTLTVTCFIPEEDSEEISPDNDMLQDVSDGEHLEIPSPSASKELGAIDLLASNDLAQYMDYKIFSAERKLSKHRSSEFMLSHLMPIDEAAEFTDNAAADADNNVHSFQPVDELIHLKTESDDSDVYNVSASPTIEHAYHLCHELTDKVQQDNITEDIVPELASSLSDAYNLDITPVVNNGCNSDFSGDKQQITYEDGHSSVEHSVNRHVVNVGERQSPVQQDIVSEVEGTSSDTETHDSTTSTDAAQAEGFDNSEHAAVTTDSPRSTFCEDHTTNSDGELMTSAANTTQHSSPVYSVVKTAEITASDSAEEHSVDVNTTCLQQNDLLGTASTEEQMDSKDQNIRDRKTVDLDMEMSGDEAVQEKNSVSDYMTGLKYQNDPWKQSAETAFLLGDRSKMKSNDIQAVLDAFVEGLNRPIAATANAQHHVSHTNTNDRDGFHSFSSTANNSPAVLVVKPPTEVEEPAVETLTDFESTLEQLHQPEQTKYQ